VLSRADGSYYIRPGVEDGLLLEGLQFASPDMQQALVSLFSASELLQGQHAVAVDPAVLLTHKSADGSALAAKQPAFKSTTISHVPETVLIRLARNPATVTSRMDVREMMDFGMCCERSPGAPPKPDVRRLIGVVVHVGKTMDGGHYYSFVRHNTGEWCACHCHCSDLQRYELNDETAKVVTLEDVLARSSGCNVIEDRQTKHHHACTLLCSPS
jgi:hypothetical protein